MKKDDGAALVAEARDRLRVAMETDERQRERETEDLKFLRPEFQWDEKERRLRDEQGRPALSISKIAQPRQLVLNQMRAADLGVLVHPLSEEADDETAKMIAGLYRSIERESRAELVRFWAFDRAVSAGRGVYRVVTELDKRSPYGDQCIRLRRILHQDGVFFDPEASEPDCSDGRFAFVCTYMSRDEFKRQYPDVPPPPEGQIAWGEFEKDAPEWVREDDVLVAEYWYKRPERVKIDTPDGPQEMDTEKVYMCLMSGWTKIGESQPWPGMYIPLVPTIGNELQPYDASRAWEGMVRPARDGQKFYNHAASSLVEEMGQETKVPWTAPIEAIEGYEKFWQQANQRAFSVLPFHHKDKDGEVIPAPQRTQKDHSGASLALLALREADQFIQASTVMFDPSLGRENENERSGRAILALQQQGDAGTSQYIQNLADISMTLEAKIVLDLMPHVYDRPGRVVRIVMGDDKQSKPVIVNQPFMMDPNTGQPAPAQPGAQGKVETFDLRRGVYDVSVTVGKSFQTRLQEGSDRVGQILQARPELFPLMGDIFLRFQDWPGASEMADRMVKVREKMHPGLGEDEDGQIPPEQLQAMIQQLQQQLQQLGMEHQAAVKALETEQAKQQAKMAEAQLDNQTKLQIAQLDNETKRLVAGLKAQADEQKAQMQQIIALLKGEEATAKIASESEEKELDREHELALEVTKSALEPPDMQYRGGGEPLTREEGE